MSRKTVYIGMLALLVILMFGINIQAGKTIDKLKFPSLREPEMPEFKTITLENGLVLYLMEDHELPLVNASARIAAGSYLDSPDKAGLGSITGTVLRTGGTQNKTGDEIDEILESIGASIEVGINNTSGTVGMNILSEYTDTGLKLFADILKNPVFDEDKIELAKTQVRSGISRRNDQPFPICIREFIKILYGAESGLAGQAEYYTIDNIAQNDLIEFHQKYITPENVRLAVWGDFNSDEMAKKIKGYFGDWQMGTETLPPLPEVNYEYELAVHFIDKPDVNQSSILIGHIGGLLGDPDYFPMIVANNILGGSFGSRLFNNVRSKQGLAYSVGGSFTSNIAYPGIYYNYCQTKSESTVKAIRGIIEQIKGMQTDIPTDDEMRIGKDGYLNSFVFNFEDKGDVITQIMEYDYFDFPRDFQFKAKSNVEKVTAQDVIDIAIKKLHPDQVHIVVVGNGADFDEPLSVLGPVDTIDVSIPTGDPSGGAEITEEAAVKGKEIMQKAFTACGGADNYTNIKTVTIKSTVSIVTPQGDIPLQSKSSTLFPDKERTDLTTPMGAMISVSNGADSWAKQGPQVVPASAEDIENNKKDFFRNSVLTFQNIDNPDYIMGWTESSELDGKQVEVVLIQSSDGKYSYSFVIDSETFMPIGKKYFGQTIMGPANLTEIYSDYKEVSGIMVPFKIVLNSD
ncbi:MAG: insulinase family protein, partial [candidate division Zixibacteria bacterium]|nr:insulinase family protein [candidate division Zixibacteria bacterium]